MRFVILDFETYYDDTYTLNKMSTEEYIRDPRFEAHGAAVKWDPDTLARWYPEKELRYYLKQEDWSDTYLVAHHTQFDGLILGHHYGVYPKMYGCTLGMAREMLGNHHSVSLDSLRKHFNIPPKITPYNLFKGRHWHEMDADTQRLVGEGACDEVESIFSIFGKLLAMGMPMEELHVLDLVLKMFTQPVLRADVDLLAKIWETEARNKADRLARLGVTESDLQSADRFAALLREKGIEPETKMGKVSAKTGKARVNYCFAKTDDFMRELQEDEDEEVRALAEARLGVKSTLMQTRAETLGYMASRGPLCVYLNFAGAGTLRVSGGDGANWLNFKRNSDIRRSIVAPEGHLCCPIDASQIECRVLHYLAGGPDEPVIQKFRNKEDPYVDLASRFYGETIYKPKPDDPRRAEMEAKRGMGKQGRLMCGYGAAGLQFKKTAKNGLYGPPVDIPLEDAEAFVKMYRETNPSICAKNTGYWARCSKLLARLAGGDPMEFGPMRVENKRLIMPNGAPMIYDTLEYYVPTPDEYDKYRESELGGHWRVRTRHGWKTMWGSKLTQNICEAISRLIVSQAALRIHQQYGLRPLNWPYDELLYVIPKDKNSDKLVEALVAEVEREVSWLPGLPLEAEATPGERYSK